MGQSETQHIRELSAELLDDIELSKLPTDKLLLKCSRLARLAGSEEIRKWIEFELGGYNSQDPTSLLYMTKTGRWTNYEKKQGFWGPFAQQEATVAALKAKITSLRVPDISGDWALAATKNVVDQVTGATNAISSIEGVISRVIALLHKFISNIFYRMQFEAFADSIFDGYVANTDNLIGVHAGNILEKIPSIIRRLQEGDPEGVSQALNTCRRILEAFADAIYPARDGFVELGGNQVSLGQNKHQNRINAFIARHTSSESRRRRLRQNLSNLFDRVTTGVHNDVTTEESHALFLNCYLLLGEIIHLNTESSDFSNSDSTN